MYLFLISYICIVVVLLVYGLEITIFTLLIYRICVPIFLNGFPSISKSGAKLYENC